MNENIKEFAEDLYFAWEYEIVIGNKYDFVAEKLAKKGYRKESDTAREILKWLVGRKHLFNRTHEIGVEKPRTSYLIMDDEIEELAKKYGVDLRE